MRQGLLSGLRDLSSFPCLQRTAEYEVAFLTDVEGNIGYFERWVQMSRILAYTGPDRKALTLTHPRAYFVYGGDVADRGDGGERLLRLLVGLKRDYPDRVSLLVGNRDLNKLRMTSELAPSDLARHHSMIPPIHWDISAPTLSHYLEEVAAARGGGATADDCDCAAERLRWMYKHTLGCPETFELRRKEISDLRSAAAVAEPGAANAAAVTDQDVVASARADLQSGGAMHAYLHHACVAAIVGETIFVHGAVDAQTAGLVPAHSTRFVAPAAPQPMRRVSTPQAWVTELNALLQRGLADHAAQPEWDASRTSRGGEVLLALQNRDAMWGRSVVSNCYADGGCITTRSAAAARLQAFERAEANKDCRAFSGVLSEPRDERVAAWLKKGGIRRVVVGHKPSGDSPAVLSGAYTGVEIISADTSYADAKAADGRGVAVAGVLLRGPSLHQTRTEIYGVLATGERHAAVLAPPAAAGGQPVPTAAAGVSAGDASAGSFLSTLASLCRGRPSVGDAGDDRLIGTMLEDGWWVKARTVAGEGGQPARYLCCRGAGRQVEYTYRDAEPGGCNPPRAEHLGAIQLGMGTDTMDTFP